MNARLFTAITGAGLTLLLLAAALPAAEPRLEKTDLFEAGKGGHKLYRIPGLVVTARGTVLAYCEARKHTGLDAVQP
jgi:sialidase-1